MPAEEENKKTERQHPTLDLNSTKVEVGVGEGKVKVEVGEEKVEVEEGEGKREEKSSTEDPTSGGTLEAQFYKIFKGGAAVSSELFGKAWAKIKSKFKGKKPTPQIIVKSKLDQEVKEQPEPSADPNSDSLYTVNSKPNSTLTSAVSVLKSVLKPMFKLFSDKPKPAVAKKTKDNPAKVSAKDLTVKVLDATRKMPSIEAAFFNLKENSSATGETKSPGSVNPITTAYKFTTESSRRSLFIQIAGLQAKKKKEFKEETPRAS